MKNEKIYQLFIVMNPIIAEGRFLLKIVDGVKIVDEARADSEKELEMYKYNAIISLRKCYKNIEVSRHYVNNVKLYLIRAK